MKKLQRLVCLLPILTLLATARAQVPAAAPDSSAPAADAAPQPVDPAKETEIRKLLELTGTVKMTSQMMDRMISSFKMQNSGVSAEFWERFKKEADIQGLVDKMVPIYAKYYSLDDLKAINAFYGTPLGQRMLATTPKIMQESMQIGQNWGRNVAMKLMAELQAEKEKGSASTPVPATAPAPATAPPTP
ncbi:MAG TPA: DUF2059 domain-containing protein [Candidatus Methylacidiphilales bacterium]|jgi:hypothetical protein|nr:DUF2059 domain-containing protein [Candidatus Methylacidiphilales bacterium]